MDTQAPFIRSRFNPNWCAQVFSAKAAKTGGIIRRQVADVEREVGRAYFYDQVERRGFHLIECGPQFVVICAVHSMRVHL